MNSEPSVELAPGADENGFALMVAQLIRDNLAERPRKKKTLAHMHGRVALVVTDLNLVVGIHFNGGRVRVVNGFPGIPDLTVRAPSDWHMKMSLLELEPRFGLPDPRGENTRAMFAATGSGEVQMSGMWRALPLALRLTKLFSVVA